MLRQASFFVAGFAAGEGSFAILSRGKPFRDGSERLRFTFSIIVASRDRPLLEAARVLIGTGAISDYKGRATHLQPTSRFDAWSERDHIAATIPFFETYLLESRKRQQFIHWRDALFAYRDRRDSLARGRSACSVEGCTDPVRGRGLCRRHYYRATGY